MYSFQCAMHVPQKVTKRQGSRFRHEVSLHLIEFNHCPKRVGHKRYHTYRPLSYTLVSFLGCLQPIFIEGRIIVRLYLAALR